MTISDAVNEGAHMLRVACIPEDRRTARLLLGHVLELDPAQTYTRSDDCVSDEARRDFLSLIQRRAAGEPCQYITGHQEFYGLDFTVTPDVLIPRPETEFLVERVLHLAGKSHVDALHSQTKALPGNEGKPFIVDLGTGSGCVAIALASNLPAARVIATDISASAIGVARLNAAQLGVAERVSFFIGDLFEPLREQRLFDQLDFIACNPPYVPAANRDSLQREVCEFEPAIALFGGEDGLEFYRRLLIEAGSYLRPGGYLVFEIGYSQMEVVDTLIDHGQWSSIEVTNDLQGIPRTISARLDLLQSG